jgi:nitroreductase
MENLFANISQVIRNRRSIKPVNMNGLRIPDEQVKEILELANWAPTHGRTEPWRFIVYSGDEVKEFSHQHAELYKSNTPAENYLQANYDKHFHNGDKASHLIVAIMQRGAKEKIPVLEEIASTAASIQNILLGATAAGLASFWSTGGMTHKQPMKDLLHLKEADLVMGIIYLGGADEHPEGKRDSSIEEKTQWK